MTKAHKLARFDTTNINPATLDATGTIPTALLDHIETPDGVNTPMFKSFLSGQQQVASYTWTQATLDGESYDTDDKFANNRFTPTVAGYYYLKAQVAWASLNDFNMSNVRIRLNGTNTLAMNSIEHDHYNGIGVSTIVYADVDDYFEMEIYQNSGVATSVNNSANNTYFMGFKLII